MRRAELVAIAVVMLIAVLTTVAFAETQQPNPDKARPDRQTIRRGRQERMANWLARELNLTEEEKAPVMLQIRKVIALKRRAIPGLRRLKALRRNEKASAEEVAAGLKRFLNNLADARAKIIREEKKLVEMEEITPRRELTLTILGILNNGRSLRRIPTGRPRAKEKEGAEQPEIEKRSSQTSA